MRNAHLPQILHPHNEPSPDLSSFPHRDKNGQPLTRGLYRLTAALDNEPYRDRRQNGFWDDVRIPAGTLVLVEAWQHPGERLQALYSRPGHSGSRGLYEGESWDAKSDKKGHARAMALFGLSVPVPISTPGQVFHTDDYAYDVLAILIKQGRLSLREIADLAQQAYDAEVE